ncbi:hypothetical protein RclHR1_07460009 [Rhizophagus clarus]|uniref:Uncharacterized protein n=1 Tax=Rhizophagus clarus TaxID=94130 RepID=A0A2Z6S3C9_9GLOM|nr:hypothetical protein RclHR1_07460009 [Rhizophagus clarus]
MRSLLNTEKFKIKNSTENDKINDDKIKGNKISRCNKCKKIKPKQENIVTVPVDQAPSIENSKYNNKKWILRKISIKKQRRYKSVKISVNWIRSKERSSDEKCLRIDLSYKEEIIVTRWFQGSWKAREIRDYLKNKLFTPILVDVTTENRPRYYDQLFRIYKIIITLYALNQLK